MTQVWPAADAFDHGSPAYGTNLIGYLGARVASSGFQAGRIHSGYGAGTAAARAQNQSDTTGDTVAFLRRQPFPAAVRVKLVSKKFAVSGQAVVSHLKKHSVIARASGGTLENDGASHVLLKDLTCYALKLEWIAALQALRLRLQRFDAGTPVVLAELVDTGGSIGNLLNDTTLVLEVVDDGAGDVVLTASAGGLETGGSLAAVTYAPGGHGGKTVTTALSPHSGTPLQSPAKIPGQLYAGIPPTVLLTATDSSGSKITAGGRCGFGIDPERVIASPAANVVSIASLFEVTDLTDAAAPVVLWRDEFSRLALPLCEAMTDRFGTDGFNLASDYAADQASVAAQVLSRSTADESVSTPTTVDYGGAVQLDGVSDHLTLATPEATFPAPALASQTEVTIAVWASLTENRDGNEFYTDIDHTTVPSDGLGFGWRKVDATNAKLQGRLVRGATAELLTYDSAPFVAASLLGQAWRYVMTYKANASPGTGEGRLRFYAGRLGAATLLGEVAVPASVRPVWVVSDLVPQFVGFRDFFTGTAAETYLKGTVDEVAVFHTELDAASVALLCSENLDPAIVEALGVVAGWHLDAYTDVGGADGKRWAPWAAAAPGGPSADPADWLREVNGVTPVTGLIPTWPGNEVVAWHQRPASDSVAQHRSFSWRPAGAGSVAGVLVRGAPTSDPAVWSGYRLDVAPGAPARVALYRVLAGEATLVAEQDPVTGTVDVSVATYAEVALQVAQQPGGGSLGPVVLTARIDGVIVPMQSVLPSEVVIDLDGNVVDLGSDRIVSGPAVGFYALADGLLSRFDDWAEGASGAGTTAAEVPGYALPEEADGATGQLEDVLEPGWSIELSAPAPRAEAQFESGHRARWLLDGYERREFELSRPGATDAEILALRTFWDDHDGGVIPFQWDPGVVMEEQQAGYWRFVEDSLQDEWVNGARRTRFRVEEVRAPSPS